MDAGNNQAEGETKGEAADAAAAAAAEGFSMNPEDMLKNFKEAVGAGSKGLHFYQTFTQEGALEVPGTVNTFEGVPLPFVIGTRPWMADENIGLIVGTCASCPALHLPCCASPTPCCPVLLLLLPRVQRRRRRRSRCLPRATPAARVLRATRRSTPTASRRPAGAAGATAAATWATTPAPRVTMVSGVGPRHAATRAPCSRPTWRAPLLLRRMRKTTSSAVARRGYVQLHVGGCGWMGGA